MKLLSFYWQLFMFIVASDAVHAPQWALAESVPAHRTPAIGTIEPAIGTADERLFYVPDRSWAGRVRAAAGLSRRAPSAAAPDERRRDRVGPPHPDHRAPR